MGNGNMYPMHPYPDENFAMNQPYCHHGSHTMYNPMMPSYGYPYSQGRGFVRPFAPVPNYTSIMPSFQQPIYPGQMNVRGYFTNPRGTTGGLQSAPPSQAPNGNIHVHRPGEYRPHFDQQ